MGVVTAAQLRSRIAGAGSVQGAWRKQVILSDHESKIDLLNSEAIALRLPVDDPLLQFVLNHFTENRQNLNNKKLFYISTDSKKTISDKKERINEVFPHLEIEGGFIHIFFVKTVS